MPKSAPVDRDESNAPRSRKGAETRARLLEAGKEVFEENGFLDARISDIADRAGLSHGSFYHYFESKEQIFREVADIEEARLTSPPDDPAFVISPDDSIHERIRKANRRYLEHYRDESRIMGVIEQMSRYDEHVKSVRMTRQKHFADRSERAIKAWQAEGSVDRELDAGVAAMALGAMVARFAELWLVQGYAKYPFDRAVDQLTLLWANALGLKPEPAPRRRRRTKAG